MDWLFKPKVQLGLFVNFVFVVFTLFSSTSGEQVHARRQYVTVEPDPVTMPYAPLPPNAAPSSAATSEANGRVYVSLTKDLTLVNKPGHALVFSPYFNVRKRPYEQPTSVKLRFIIFSDKSDKELCPGACMLVINADGSHLLDSAANGTFSSGWTREVSPTTSSALGSGEVVQTLAAETLTTDIPFETFVGMISARRVVVSLGPDKVELTHEQIEAMREMYRRVTPSPAEQQEEKLRSVKSS